MWHEQVRRNDESRVIDDYIGDTVCLPAKLSGEDLDYVGWVHVELFVGKEDD